MSLDYVSNQEIIQAARRNLPQDVWDYLTGGAESETTMRRNRYGFDSLGLRPGCWWTFQRSTRRRLSWGRSCAFP
jgi:isopentenyl diphosphate isomerase/L-lactate dehydrogenase-like FMN-dependent dehydrogenase